MPVKQIELPGIGQVSLYKRKDAKSMRLSIRHDGEVRLTLPKWTPYSAGIIFINSHISWIEKHKTPKPPEFSNNLRVGKAHSLTFIETVSSRKINSRVTQTEIKVFLPQGHSVSSDEVQATARTAVLKALKHEADRLLPQKVESLAKLYGFSYSHLKIRQLKSRWGSCNSLKQITLSYYLIQLPWELIDYVILHELVHTKVLAHGERFWDEFDKYLPGAKKLKKQLNAYKPIIDTSS